MCNPIRSSTPSIACFVLIAIAALIPGEGLAHSAERGLILLLPTEYYLWGGALAVAVSVITLILLPARLLDRALGVNVRLPALGLGAMPLFQAIGFLLFVGLLIAGFTGTPDPLRNPLPLMAWTVIWIGLAVLSALLGDLWHWINPWSAPVRLIRLCVPQQLHLPRHIGHLPAILSFGLIIWFESVSLSPSDPATLAQGVLIYWGLHLVGMVVFGEGDWRARGEALSVFFGMLGKAAILTREARHWRVHLPGAALCTGPPLSMTAVLFVCAMISGVTFDGLAGTFWWLGLIGVNPLDYPGRSAVQLEGTIGLLAVWLLFTLAFAGAVVVGCQLGRAPFRIAIGRFVLGLIPIAVAYHAAHYLTFFLVNGQYALVALSDPFTTGADWLALGPHFVTTGFLNTLDMVEMIWRAQVAIIVAGHLIGVLVVHVIAREVLPSPRDAVVGELPLAVLMVGMTALGLWLLSTPTAV